LQGHQTDSDTDSGVRDIEGWPMERTIVEFEEVNHLAIAETVDQVAEGSCEDE